MLSYALLIVYVACPSIKSEPAPVIITALAEVSTFFINQLSPLTPVAVVDGNVIVNTPVDASANTLS